MYTRINDYGFMETPYRKVVKGKVTDKVEFLDAADEAVAVIASAGEEIKEDGSFANKRVSARKHLVAAEVDVDDVTYIDAADRQIIGSSAGLIPFIEKNYVYRSLMGSNQQRQAVPLITPQAPIVGTGMEGMVARNSGQMILAEEDGEVVEAHANKVVVAYKAHKATYSPVHFLRSNEGSSINQK